MSDKCPKCGSDLQNIYAGLTEWQCGTEQRGERVFESPACISLQLSMTEAQRNQLHDALTDIMAMIDSGTMDNDVIRKANQVLKGTR